MIDSSKYRKLLEVIDFNVLGEMNFDTDSFLRSLIEDDIILERWIQQSTLVILYILVNPISFNRIGKISIATNLTSLLFVFRYSL